MSRFSYVGIDIRGKTSSGEIVANDIKEARLKIKKNGLTPVSVKSIGSTEKKAASKTKASATKAAVKKPVKKADSEDSKKAK